MGQFASTVEYYARCREQYPPRFFESIAERLSLTGSEALLDIGCGPGLLAIGFSPFVGRCTGLDPESAMIKEAKEAAEEAGVSLELHLGRIEDYPGEQLFNVATIGRALHWLHREPTLAVLKRVISPLGHVLICSATSVESSVNSWLGPYQEVCDSWSNGPDRQWYRIDPREWFAASDFDVVDQLSVSNTQRVTVCDLIGRALSWSTTSPDILGARRADFERDLFTALLPFSQEGYLREEISAHATILGRRT